MYHVSEGKGGKSHFTKIASGWDNKDGEGVNWLWELQPNGRTVSRSRASVEANREQFRGAQVGESAEAAQSVQP